MRRVVFVTQRIDPTHPTLGAAAAMVRALAREADEVVVLALAGTVDGLPPNCRIRTFGAASKGVRGVRFAAALARELTPRPEAVIAHMSPIYALLAAPLCRPLGVPVILWFTHWRVSPLLRVATRAVTAVATADRASFPFASAKVAPIGHAIDVDELPCRPDSQGGAVRALALGRTSSIKRIELLVDGVHRARDNGTEVELDIRGASETEPERTYREQLRGLVGDGVTLADPIPRTALADLFARTDVLLNATVDGSLDKAVLEACAACVPAMASSPAFASLLPEQLRFRDADELAERLRAFAALDAQARVALGHELRARVAEQHAAQSWAQRILELARRS